MKVVALGLVVLLVTSPLTGCGEDPDVFESYCSVVQDQKAELGRLLDQDDGASGLLPGLPVFERLEKAAPDDIADDWSVLVQRLTALSDALTDAGVDPTTYDPADPPAGLDAEQRDAISLAAGSLGSDAVAAALGNVQQQARDVCKSELL